jgi:hypothetical protein
MDLRKEFDAILEQYGYPVLVVRSERKVRCSCWNEKTQEATKECPVCFGLGWVPIVEKHMTRCVDTSVPESLAMLGAEKAPFGAISVPGRSYYMRYNAQLRPTDLIVDVEWNDRGKPIYNGGGIYEVSHVDPKRFERGELIYNKIYVRDTPVEKQIRGIRIANANGIKNYEIMEG